MLRFGKLPLKAKNPRKNVPYQEAQIVRFCLDAGYELIDIKISHILALRELKLKKDYYSANYDPFDRILIAQAKSENCVLLSHDTNFKNYDETCIRMI